MKGLELNVTKQNGMTLVEYQLGVADVYDDRVSDKVAQLGNIIPFQYKDEDGKRSIVSYVHHDTSKEEDTQSERTKKRAEVFTPSWIVNQMNNSIDEEWFGRKNVFNVEEEMSWNPTTEDIKFPEGKTWQDYIQSTRLEITCGEAPFLVSRYDVSSGERIPKTINRMGILDRKLRIVNENVTTKTDWINWAVKSVQSCYGYEYQGDSLLIARINVLLTFVEYYEEKWNEKVDSKTLLKLANIISWNIWQMDGLTGTVPFSDEIKSNEQVSLFETNESTEINCRIFDWKANKSQEFNELKEK